MITTNNVGFSRHMLRGAINSRCVAAVAAPSFTSAAGSTGSAHAERCRVNSRAFPLRRPPFSRADFDFGFMNLV